MKKILLIVIGSISFVSGVIGIFLPVIPTVPFLLLSLWCYMRSSEKLYYYIVEHKHLGPIVRDYISKDGIPVRAKKKAILMTWITIGFTTVFILENFHLRTIMVSSATLVTIYIITRNTVN